MKEEKVTLIMTFLFALMLAVVLAGCGGGHKTAPTTPDTTAPTTPTNLLATAASSTQVDLSWDAATDAVGVTGYKIYRDGVNLKSVTDISTSDAVLNPNTQYCYTISAYDAVNNESPQSAPACIIPFSSGVIDISHAGTGGFTFGIATDQVKRYQTFIADAHQSITGVDVKIRKWNTDPYDAVFVKLYDTDANHQPANLLATSSIDTGSLSTSFTVVSAPLTYHGLISRAKLCHCFRPTDGVKFQQSRI